MVLHQAFREPIVVVRRRCVGRLAGAKRFGGEDVFVVDLAHRRHLGQSVGAPHPLRHVHHVGPLVLAHGPPSVPGSTPFVGRRLQDRPVLVLLSHDGRPHLGPKDFDAAPRLLLLDQEAQLGMVRLLSVAQRQVVVPRRLTVARAEGSAVHAADNVRTVLHAAQVAVRSEGAGKLVLVFEAEVGRGGGRGSNRAPHRGPRGEAAVTAEASLGCSTVPGELLARQGGRRVEGPGPSQRVLQGAVARHSEVRLGVSRALEPPHLHGRRRPSEVVGDGSGGGAEGEAVARRHAVAH
mmetsp:Transcript_3717/g.8755  ORF Transcript_3717/g.8755 Transcript_3717/m.8755 type:complete len:293 (+) Transcript_3717:297-1175(+)